MPQSGRLDASIRALIDQWAEDGFWKTNQQTLIEELAEQKSIPNKRKYLIVGVQQLE